MEGDNGEELLQPLHPTPTPAIRPVITVSYSDLLVRLPPSFFSFLRYAYFLDTLPLSVMSVYGKGHHELW